MRGINSGLLFLVLMVLSLSSCVGKKKYAGLQRELDVTTKDLNQSGERISDYMARLAACQSEKMTLKSDIKNAKGNLKLREEQIQDLKDQIADIRRQRDRQGNTVDELTVLSQSANDNIKETLNQLEGKDKYIKLLQEAKTKADSVNLALAVNLKGQLSQGIADNDINIKVDKTVVMINLSDKMLFQSGSASINPSANTVLGKIATIIRSRPNLEVMVEGYTDNVPMKTSCIEDNWDLSVKRAASVVRTLQKNHGINPDRLIAAGRGQYNMMASNDTPTGRQMNRRTRIIILPKLNEFYDLLNPDKVPN